MKPIITTSIITTVGNTGISGTDCTAEEEARQRRDTERARLRRLQNDRHQHTEAEHRLAAAMARASARAPRPGTESPRLASIPEVPETDNCAVAMIESEEAGIEARQSAVASQDTSAAIARPKDPVKSLLQRLASGDTRGLLRDCSPLLDALLAYLARGAIPPAGREHAETESLASALDFLQGYADATAARLPAAGKFAQKLMEVRQQFDALQLAGTPPAGSMALAGEQLFASQSQTNGQTSHSTRARDPVNATRKARTPGRREIVDDEETCSEVAGIAVASQSSGVRERSAIVHESSLDKDQRKRREDTLPLVTLRSI